jgi:hypothetical protein
MIAFVLVGVIVLGATAGSGQKKSAPRSQRSTFSDPITTREYIGLRRDLSEQDVANRLMESGTPENSVSLKVADLFPRHSHEVICNFYIFSDRSRTAARLCYDALGNHLVQKRERQAPAGVIPGQ